MSLVISRPVYSGVLMGCTETLDRPLGRLFRSSVERAINTKSIANVVPFVDTRGRENISNS